VDNRGRPPRLQILIGFTLALLAVLNVPRHPEPVREDNAAILLAGDHTASNWVSSFHCTGARFGTLVVTARHCLNARNTSVAISQHGQLCLATDMEIREFQVAAKFASSAADIAFLNLSKGPVVQQSEVRSGKAGEIVTVAIVRPRSPGLNCNGVPPYFLISPTFICKQLKAVLNLQSQQQFLNCLLPLSATAICNGDSGAAVLNFDKSILGVITGARSCIPGSVVLFTEATAIVSTTGKQRTR